MEGGMGGRKGPWGVPAPFLTHHPAPLAWSGIGSALVPWEGRRPTGVLPLERRGDTR